MRINSQIGEYKIMCEVGRGSYFTHYRCVDKVGNKVFLKLINPAKLDNRQLDTLTYEPLEIGLLNNLRHPNIIAQKASGEEIIDGQRYFYTISEFFPGETISSKLSREIHLSLFDVKSILVGVLNALKYLHSQHEPVIYNGINPENIYLDLTHAEPIAKLSNFGFALRLNKENRKCYVDGLSPFYMAPEMFKGLYSTRTDLYAVGVLMYHLIYGIEPWKIDLTSIEPNKRNEVLNEARKTPLPIPNIDILGFDEHLLKVMAKALNQDVDERFQNADEFIAALNNTINVESTNYQLLNPDKKPATTEGVQTPTKGNGFADVAGLEGLKNQLTEEVINLLREPEKYRRLRVKIPNGALLYGPPGCGKTFIAEKFAEELGCNFIKVDCSDIASPYIHGGQSKIAELFKEAEDNAPTVLFLDEIDAMVTDRKLHNNVSEQGEVNVFLTNLNNCSDRGIFVIGATNNPEVIDPAALRSGRLDIKAYIPLPDKEERMKILQLTLADRCEPEIDYELLADKTEGYVTKDICQMVNKAALVTAKNDGVAISQKTLLETIEAGELLWPSVSSQEIEHIEKIKKEFESKTSSRPPVGFKTKIDD